MKYTYDELELRLSDALQQLDVQSARSDALAAKLNDVCAENAAIKRESRWGVIKIYTVFSGDDSVCQGTREKVVPLSVQTPNTDAWVNEQRAAILNAAFEAAKQEVERRFGRTFQDCAWLARRSSDTQMKGAVEMAEWVELYAAQLRGSQV